MRDGDEKERLTPLSDDLQTLVERVGPREVSMQEILDALEERGTAVVIILMAAPFVLPIPLPGLSILFGAGLVFLGPRLASGREPWLPGFLARRRIQAKTLAAIVRAVGTVARPIERLLRPRHAHLFGRGMHLAVGAGIVLSAILLLPPFPMPGINALPSLAIVLFALGLMEKDLGAVVLGCVVMIAGYAYLYLWWDVAMRAMRQFV